MENEVEEEEVACAFLGCDAVMQCLECGTVTKGQIVNQSPEVLGFIDPETGIECPTCTQAKGHPCIMPFVPLVGDQIQLLDSLPPEEEQADTEEEAPAFQPDGTNLPPIENV